MHVCIVCITARREGEYFRYFRGVPPPPPFTPFCAPGAGVQGYVCVCVFFINRCCGCCLCCCCRLSWLSLGNLVAVEIDIELSALVLGGGGILKGYIVVVVVVVIFVVFWWLVCGRGRGKVIRDGAGGKVNSDTARTADSTGRGTLSQSQATYVLRTYL